MAASTVRKYQTSEESQLETQQVYNYSLSRRGEIIAFFAKNVIFQCSDEPRLKDIERRMMHFFSAPPDIFHRHQRASKVSTIYIGTYSTDS